MSLKNVQFDLNEAPKLNKNLIGLTKIEASLLISDVKVLVHETKQFAETPIAIPLEDKNRHAHRAKVYFPISRALCKLGYTPLVAGIRALFEEYEGPVLDTHHREKDIIRCKKAYWAMVSQFRITFSILLCDIKELVIQSPDLSPNVVQTLEDVFDWVYEMPIFNNETEVELIKWNVQRPGDYFPWLEARLNFFYFGVTEADDYSHNNILPADEPSKDHKEHKKQSGDTAEIVLHRAIGSEICNDVQGQTVDSEPSPTFSIFFGSVKVNVMDPTHYDKASAIGVATLQKDTEKIDERVESSLSGVDILSEVVLETIAADVDKENTETLAPAEDNLKATETAEQLSKVEKADSVIISTLVSQSITETADAPSPESLQLPDSRESSVLTIDETHVGEELDKCIEDQSSEATKVTADPEHNEYPIVQQPLSVSNQIEEDSKAEEAGQPIPAGSVPKEGLEVIEIVTTPTVIPENEIQVSSETGAEDKSLEVEASLSTDKSSEIDSSQLTTTTTENRIDPEAEKPSVQQPPIMTKVTTNNNIAQCPVDVPEESVQDSKVEQLPQTKQNSTAPSSDIPVVAGAAQAPEVKQKKPRKRRNAKKKSKGIKQIPPAKAAVCTEHKNVNGTSPSETAKVTEVSTKTGATKEPRDEKILLINDIQTGNKDHPADSNKENHPPSAGHTKDDATDHETAPSSTEKAASDNKSAHVQDANTKGPDNSSGQTSVAPATRKEPVVSKKEVTPTLNQSNNAFEKMPNRNVQKPTTMQPAAKDGEMGPADKLVHGKDQRSGAGRQPLGNIPSHRLNGDNKIVQTKPDQNMPRNQQSESKGQTLKPTSIDTTEQAVVVQHANGYKGKNYDYYRDIYGEWYHTNYKKVKKEAICRFWCCNS